MELFPNVTLKGGIFFRLEQGLQEVSDLYLAVTAERMNMVDFIWPTTIVPTYLYMAMANKFTWVTYTLPFESGVWIAIISWVCVAVVVGCVFNRATQRVVNLSEAVLTVWQAMCNQGGETRLHVYSACYIALYIPYMLGVVLVPAYSGSIRSFMTVKDYTPPFQDIPGLIADGRYKLATYGDSYAALYFDTSDHPQVQASKRFLVPHTERPRVIQDAYPALCSHPEWVLVASEGVDCNAQCKVVELNSAVFVQSTGFAVGKNCPFKTVFLRSMHQMHYSGLVKWKSRTHFIFDENNESLLAFSLTEIIPLLVLHSIGLGIALLLFTTELFYHCVCRNK